mgnify:CR=1 FL=1
MRRRDNRIGAEEAARLDFHAAAGQVVARRFAAEADIGERFGAELDAAAAAVFGFDHLAGPGIRLQVQVVVVFDALALEHFLGQLQVGDDLGSALHREGVGAEGKQLKFHVAVQPLDEADSLVGELLGQPAVVEWVLDDLVGAPLRLPRLKGVISTAETRKEKWDTEPGRRLPGILYLPDLEVCSYFAAQSGYCFPSPALDVYYLIGRDKNYLRRLARVLEAAKWMPSAANLQPWEVVVVRERDTKERVVQATLDPFMRDEPDMRPLWLKEAPVLLVFCVDIKRVRTRYGYEKALVVGTGDTGAFLLAGSEVIKLD